ncbi:MAG: class I SAM-dependent methyltransferase [Actinobacteria bacterium]|nr:class I SAM-dependent methyltransferase [Actinomycetota bacterium]
MACYPSPGSVGRLLGDQRLLMFRDRRPLGSDSMATILELPMRMSAALVRESGIRVQRVVDVGSGPGTYLRIFLEEFPGAEGVWIDPSEAMRTRAEESMGDLLSRLTFTVGDSAMRRPSRSRVMSSCPPERSITFSLRPSNASIEPQGGRSPPVGSSSTSITSPRRETGKGKYKAIKPRFVPSSGGGGESHTHDAPPQLVEDHLAWLRGNDFTDPDVPWRLFWTALVVARTPSG